MQRVLSQQHELLEYARNNAARAAQHDPSAAPRRARAVSAHPGVVGDDGAPPRAGKRKSQHAGRRSRTVSPISPRDGGKRRRRNRYNVSLTTRRPRDDRTPDSEVSASDDALTSDEESELDSPGDTRRHKSSTGGYAKINLTFDGSDWYSYIN
ncbi:MAG: hypothetical protein AAF125_28405, partial [Chloroflexota bacterium]